MNSVARASLFTGVLLLSPGGAAHSAPGTQGFVVTGFAPAVYAGDDTTACPEGFNEAPDLHALLAKAPPAKRIKSLRSEYRLVLACNGGEIYKTLPAFKTVAGRKSYGLNLDRSDDTKPSANFCAHDNFVSPSGERGIDNQWYRVIGCLREARPGGIVHEYFNTSIRKGELAILIEISGIDDAGNDDEVRVGFYRAAEPTTDLGKLARGNSAQRVHYDSHYHSVARGRIAKGVLTTEPIDIRLQELPFLREFVIRDARVKMNIDASGRLKGVLGGYQEFRLLFDAISLAAAADITLGPLTCPYFNPRLGKLPDGYPDLPNGESCTWISVAYEVEAAPATVIHPERARQAAAKPTG